MNARRALASGFLVAVLASIALPGGARHLIRAIDDHVAGEPLKDAWGRLRWREDWTSAEPVDPRRVDPAWMASAGTGELRIAHALGAANQPGSNTLGAMQAAAARGFQLFEVDLWLDQDGHLRCYHGDDDGSPPGPYRSEDCTFEQVLGRLGDRDWLILDIKSDFDRTGSEIVRRLGDSDERGRRLIFQLYHPEDLSSFARWSRRIRLASPIVTTCAAHRSVRHIASALPRLHVEAMTVPLSRLRQAHESHPPPLLLTHPVHDCQALRDARKGGARGLYTISSLEC